MWEGGRVRVARFGHNGRNRQKVGGRKVFCVQRFCVESQSIPVSFRDSNLDLATEYNVDLLIPVNECRMRQHQQVMVHLLRGRIECDPLPFGVMLVRHSHPFNPPLAFATFVGSLSRGWVSAGHEFLVSRGHHISRHDFLSFGKVV